MSKVKLQNIKNMYIGKEHKNIIKTGEFIKIRNFVFTKRYQKVKRQGTQSGSLFTSHITGKKL